MRLLIVPWLAVVLGLQCVLQMVASQQEDLPLWSPGQPLNLPKELLRPYFLDTSSTSIESPDYDSQKILYPSSSSRQASSSSTGTLKKRVAAMGVDLPDYILHYRGKSPDLGSFRERMQLSGRR